MSRLVFYDYNCLVFYDELKYGFYKWGQPDTWHPLFEQVLSKNNMSFPMPDKTARAFMKEAPSLLTAAISFECAAGVTRTRIDPTNGFASSDGSMPWSFNFNVYQQNANRRRPPGGNPGCGAQWKSPSRL
jgi:hypothetical protein